MRGACGALAPARRAGGACGYAFPVWPAHSTYAFPMWPAHSTYAFPVWHSTYAFPVWPAHSTYAFPMWPAHSTYAFPVWHSTYAFPVWHSTYAFPVWHSTYAFSVWPARLTRACRRVQAALLDEAAAAAAAAGPAKGAKPAAAGAGADKGKAKPTVRRPIAFETAPSRLFALCARARATPFRCTSLSLMRIPIQAGKKGDPAPAAAADEEAVSQRLVVCAYAFPVWARIRRMQTRVRRRRSRWFCWLAGGRAGGGWWSLCGRCVRPRGGGHFRTAPCIFCARVAVACRV